MIDYTTELQKMHDSQANSYGWCGLTDVELAKEIFLCIDSNFSPEDNAKYIWIIADCLKLKRTF